MEASLACGRSSRAFPREGARKGLEEVTVLPGCPRGRGTAGAARAWPVAPAALQRFCAGLSPFRQRP